MSYFLHYFEKANPNTDWSDFTSIIPSVPKTFTSFLSPSVGLFIRESTVLQETTKHPSFIISDGLSSDMIFIEDIENVQRKTFLKFLNERNKINAKIPFFFLQSTKSKRLGMTSISSDNKVKELTLSELKKIKQLEPETIYSLLK